MDDKSQAELDILEAADQWARDIMRQDKILNPLEQKLLDSVLHYQRMTRTHLEIPPVEIPKPPFVPQDLFFNEPTMRYSEVPTVRSPPNGIRAVKGLSDIEQLELDFDDED